MFINLNGNLLPAASAAIPAYSPVARWGVSLIETMRWQQGGIPLWELHMQRLSAGIQALGMVPPAHFTSQWLLSEIQNLVKKNGHLAGAKVRLQTGPAAGTFGVTNEKDLLIFIESFRHKELTFNDLGVTIGISKQHVLGSAGPYSAYKTGNALTYFGAAQEACYRGVEDVLLPALSGGIGESSRSNVFWEEGGRLYTPPLSEGIVSGIARARLLQVLSQSSFSPPSQAVLTPKRLWCANAVYLTNAVQGVRWVATCEGRSFSAGRSFELFQCLFPTL